MTKQILVPSNAGEAAQGLSAAGLKGAILLSLLLACGLHILLLKDGFYAATMDDNGRTLDALAWSEGRIPLVSVWLPFYRIVVGNALRFFPDLLITPRVVSGTFGILTLLALCCFAHELFRQRMTTAIAAFLGALLPVRIVLGIAPLSEIMFLFWLTAALASLARWRRVQRSEWLLLGSAFLTIASSVRYEGWLFLAAFIGLLAFSSEKPGVKFIGVVIAAAFPVYWMLLHKVLLGSALGFMANPVDRYDLVVGGAFSERLLNNPLVQLIGSGAITLNLFGLLSLEPLWRRERAMRLVLLLPAVALVGLAGGALIGKFLPTHNPWRIAAPWLLFLVPLTAAWVVSLLPSGGEKRSGQAAFFLVFIAGMFAWETYRSTRESALTHFDIDAGRFLKNELARLGEQDSSTVLIESRSWAYTSILITSQSPDRFVLNSGSDPMHPTPPVWSSDSATLGRMHEKRVRYIVAQWFDSRELLLATPSIHRLADFGTWTIYGVEKERKDSLP